MAYATTTGPLSKTGFQARGLIATLREAFLRHRLYVQTVNELSELSDLELADLGMNRSTIRRAAIEAAYGKAA